jgi:ferric-dicitrate binding protein FerR (iron transport regulator)
MEENYKLAKWLNNEMTDSELLAFQSEEDYLLYEKIKNYSSQLETPIFDEQKLLLKVIATKEKSSKVLEMKPNWFLRIAVILVIGLGLLFTFNTFSSSNEIALNGKQTTFLLPDNSEVTLNSGSEIDYKKWNWDKNRNLNLDGEAYFKVAKGKKFEVSTNLGKVAVLGTQFNVKARNNRFDIACFEGKVRVNYNNQEVILTKGKTVSFENNVKIIDQTISEIKPLWTSKKMQFDKEKFVNVMEEIQRQYNISIDVSKINTNQSFTGKIPSNNIDVALQSITSIYHLKYTKSNNSNYVMEEIK